MHRTHLVKIDREQALEECFIQQITLLQERLSLDDLLSSSWRHIEVLLLVSYVI
jgi:hypothetical protein